MSDPVPAPGNVPAPAPAPTPAAAPVSVTIDDFKKLDLRVGKIVSVEDHPNADKLYLAKVDLGGEVRQVVAGIKPYYPKEALVGRSVILIANLQPATIRGQESRGMILAASGAGTVSFLTPEKDVPPGSKVS